MKNRFAVLAVVLCACAAVYGDVSITGNTTTTGNMLLGSGQANPTLFFSADTGATAPCIRRQSTTSLAARLADNSAYAAWQCGQIQSSSTSGTTSIAHTGIASKELKLSPFSIGLSYSVTGNGFLITDGAIQAKGNLHFNNADTDWDTVGTGPVIKSPDGSRWRITVDNAGALSTVLVP